MLHSSTEHPFPSNEHTLLSLCTLIALHLLVASQATEKAGPLKALQPLRPLTDWASEVEQDNFRRGPANERTERGLSRGSGHSSLATALSTLAEPPTIRRIQLGRRASLTAPMQL